MDFSTLLNEAQKNESNKQPIACYQTKFAPPKKQNKQSKALSDNIKKFLARREEEEQRKILEEKRKRENLLALRDHKAQSRINKHLKVCKAANKSVLADAVDNENTAVTIAGPSQPDEDDYGYVSQEASALYNQLMNKYNAAPQKPIHSSSGKRTIKDIASTKDRVKQALKQQEVEEALGHRRKRKSSSKDAPEQEDRRGDREVDRGSVEQQEREYEKPKMKKRPAAPPMDFSELLKIAEKKQHEPVVIEVKPKTEEPERLMTKKQQKEYAKEKEWRERKEQREKTGDQNRNHQSSEQTSKSVSEHSNRNDGANGRQPTKPTIGRIPKTIEKQQVAQSKAAPPISNKKIEKPAAKPKASPSPKISERDEIREEKRKLEAEKRKLAEMRQQIEEEKKKLALNKSKQDERIAPRTADKLPSKSRILEKQLTKDRPNISGPTGSAKPRDLQINGKPKQFPPADLKPLKQKVLKDVRKPSVMKRRILDDEDEYDSELEDFIDDGIEEEGEDYSKYISEIFGYDKSKYRNVDDEDDAAMESSFAQQLKEEHVSTKIGIMEDLEDIRMEALQKKQKALMRKKLKK